MGHKALRLVIVILGALIGFVVVGRLVGALGMGTLLIGANNSWRGNNLPGIERAERFLPYWDDYIYVRSRSGRYYAQPLNPKLGNRWREVAPILVGELGGGGQSNCGKIDPSWSPAIHTLASVMGGLECGYWPGSGEFFKYSYAILDNGEIWRWRYKSPGIQWYVLIPLSRLFGVMTGGFLVWLPSSRVMRR